MARRFYSSKKESQTLSPRGSSEKLTISLEELSRKIEAWPSQQKMTLFLGTFFFFLFLGTLLAVFLNPTAVDYLAKVGRLPLVSGR